MPILPNFGKEEIGGNLEGPRLIVNGKNNLAPPKGKTPKEEKNQNNGGYGNPARG